MKIVRKSQKNMKVEEFIEIMSTNAYSPNFKVLIFDKNHEEYFAIDNIVQDFRSIVIQYMDGIEYYCRNGEVVDVISRQIENSAYEKNSHIVVFYNKCDGNFTIPYEFTINDKEVIIYCR